MNKTVKKVLKEHGHIHLSDIPKACLPRRTKALAFVRELVRISNNLRYTNERVQYSAQVAAFAIKSIVQKNGFQPRQAEVFRAVEEFVYHYENFCYRAYAYREKTLQLINAALPVGFEIKDVNLRGIQSNPVVKQAKLDLTLKKFSKQATLSKIIEDRNSLTHRLFYGSEFDHYLRPKRELPPKDGKTFSKWCKEWKDAVITRAKLTNDAISKVYDLNSSTAIRICRFKGQC